jgi:hypothetical protein
MRCVICRLPDRAAGSRFWPSALHKRVSRALVVLVVRRRGIAASWKPTGTIPADIVDGMHSVTFLVPAAQWPERVADGSNAARLGLRFSFNSLLRVNRLS